MSTRLLNELLENNRDWASRMERAHPGFFHRLAGRQAPELLWIGCSDGRVPANELVGLMPGEIFVHRNIANIVDHSDKNCLSVIQYAVAELHVKHIIVVGHYRCGGVRAALESRKSTLVDEWLASIRTLRQRHQTFLDNCRSETARWDKLCELNLLARARSVCQTSIVREAWARRQELAVHGWIYSVEDGHLRDLNIMAASEASSEGVFEKALKEILGLS